MFSQYIIFIKEILILAKTQAGVTLYLAPWTAYFQDILPKLPPGCEDIPARKSWPGPPPHP